MTPVLAALLVGALMLLAARSRARRRRRHQDAIDRGLGFTVDLLAVVLGSGGTIRQAIALVADEGPPPVRPIFGSIVERSTAGHLLVDALAEASVELGEAFHPLIGTLASAEIDGAPIGQVLARLTDDLEHHDRWREEASAGRLPVVLVPPLVVCLLPAVIIGAIVPLALVALGHLR